MPNNTTNYSLVKPLLSENYNIDIANGNMDIIDSEIKKGVSRSNGKAFNVMFPPLPLIGAKADGVTDDTAILNSLILFAFNNGYKNVVFPSGLYMIKPDGIGNQYGGISLQSNTLYDLSSGAELRSIGVSSNIYSVLNIINKNNVKVINGTATGDRNAHIGSGGEWGHVVCIIGSSNVMLDHVWAQNGWGDGIYVGEAGTEPCRNITLMKCVAHNNRRNGLAITNVKDMDVFSGMYINTNGTEPQFGVDIEADVAGSYLDNINLYNVYTASNISGGIQIVPHFIQGTSQLCNINIFGGKSENDGSHGGLVFVNGGIASNPIYGKINVSDYIVENPLYSGVSFLSWGVNSPKVNLKDCLVINPSYGKPYTSFLANSGFVVDIRTGETSGDYGNICFDNCGAIDTQTTHTLMFPIYLNTTDTGQNIDKVSVINPYSKNSLTEDTRPCQWPKGKGNVVYNPPVTFTMSSPVLASTSESMSGLEITSNVDADFNLPKANDCIDREFIFKSTNNVNHWRVVPQSTDKILPLASALAGGSPVVLFAIGDYLKIKSIGNNSWIILNIQGSIHP